VIQADLTSVKLLAQKLADAAKDAPLALERALTDIARAGNTEAKRAAKAIYNLPSARIAQDLKSRKDGGSVIVTGARGQRGPLLLSYGAVQRRAGLVVKVIKANGRKTIKGGFVAAGLSGEPVSFLRSGEKRRMRAGRNIGQLKQPLRALRGPSVANMLEKEAVNSVIVDRFVFRANDIFSKRLKKALGVG